MTIPVVQDVTIAPNPASVNMTFKIAVTVLEEELVKVVNPLFEFPFVGTKSPNLEMGEITYVQQTRS